MCASLFAHRRLKNHICSFSLSLSVCLSLSTEEAVKKAVLNALYTQIDNPENDKAKTEMEKEINKRLHALWKKSGPLPSDIINEWNESVHTKNC